MSRPDRATPLHDGHADPSHRCSEAGLTLIEVLCVVLVIGILVAIALPMYLRQTDRANDGEAKANAATMHKNVESCFYDTNDYRLCETGDAALTGHGLRVGGAGGEVTVQAASRTKYTVVSTSRSRTHFILVHDSDDRTTRSCDRDEGGCVNGAW